MKKLWNSFKIAFSMYSRIPMPKSDWTEENMSYAMCFFPWIGMVIGGLTVGVFAIEQLLVENGFAFHGWFFTVILVLIPIFVTGGIHMDGFLDTRDALASYQSKGRRLEILKDPHAGAFAILAGIVYMLLYTGVYSSLTKESVKVIAISFVLSRTLSGLSVITFPQAREKGLVADFSRNTQKRRTKLVLELYLLLTGAALILMGGIGGILVLITALVVFRYYYRMVVAQFGGVTGDLAGYFLQVCELAMAFTAVVTDIVTKGLSL